MKHLNRSILEDYDISLNAPDRLCAVQFGDDPLLMGLVDRLLDDANREGADVGVAVVQSGAAGYAKQLQEQDCLYTVFVRGETDEKEVRKEQVVQSVLRALDPDKDDDALMALAGESGVRFAILHADETGEFALRNQVNAALLARWLVERWRAGIGGMAVIVCGDDSGCAETAKEQVLELAEGWNTGAEFSRWLDDCRFFPALADCLVFRSQAEEAARLCAEMNYADAMIHLAEPYGLWAIQADEAFRTEFPLDEKCAQIRFVDDISAELLKKHRFFDAGIFAMSALGYLHGNGTLADCMKDEALRDLVGHALYDEVLPYSPVSREEAAAYVIRCCERYENPMNDNRILDCAAGLLRKFRMGVLPVMRAYADEHFAAPERLTLGLAATILLYSGAREDEGVYTVLMDNIPEAVHDDPALLEAFSLLAPDMSPDSLAYAALADRELWAGADLREIDGMEEKVTELLRKAEFSGNKD